MLAKFWPLLRIKAVIVKQAGAKISFQPAMLSQFPALDKAELDRRTDELKRLGFEELGDFTLVRDVTPVIPGFMRLFVNTRSHCFAEVHQVFPPMRKATPISVAVTSYMSDAWSLSTGQRKPNTFTYVMRRPRAVSQVVLNGSVSDMVNQHLALRAQMSSELGVRESSETSAEAYFRRAQEAAEQRRMTVANKSTFAIWSDLVSFKLRPKYGWRGEWEKRAASKPKPGYAVASFSQR
jgi:hypothetical protein